MNRLTVWDWLLIAAIIVIIVLMDLVLYEIASSGA